MRRDSPRVDRNGGVRTAAELLRLRYGIILGHMERVAAAAIVDDHGVVTAWSEGARQLTGYGSEDVVGRAAADLLVEAALRETAAALTGVTVLTGVAVLRHRDGHPVEIALTACPVLGPDGGPHGYVITAERPGGPEPTPEGRAFQQASVPMCAFGTDLRFLRLNDSACRGWGAPRSPWWAGSTGTPSRRTRPAAASC